MTDDIDKMTLQELLDYRPPTWWQQMERRFFDHPHDPPKEFRFCGHHYMLAPSEPNRWAAFSTDELEALALRESIASDLGLLNLASEAKAELKRGKHPNS